MKLILLAGASFLALMAGSATAATVTFDYTGAWVSYPITQTGAYQILAYGLAGEAPMGAAEPRSRKISSCPRAMF